MPPPTDLSSPDAGAKEIVWHSGWAPADSIPMLAMLSLHQLRQRAVEVYKLKWFGWMWFFLSSKLNWQLLLASALFVSPVLCLKSHLFCNRVQQICRSHRWQRGMPTGQWCKTRTDSMVMTIQGLIKKISFAFLLSPHPFSCTQTHTHRVSPWPTVGGVVVVAVAVTTTNQQPSSQSLFCCLYVPMPLNLFLTIISGMPLLQLLSTPCCWRRALIRPGRLAAPLLDAGVSKIKSWLCAENIY